MIKKSDISVCLFKKAHGQIWRNNKNKSSVLYLYIKKAKDIKKNENLTKIIELANLLFKNDNRGIETAKYCALSDAFCTLESFNGIFHLSINTLKKNFHNTNKLCGCTGKEGCCGYCYPGA